MQQMQRALVFLVGMLLSVSGVAMSAEKPADPEIVPATRRNPERIQAIVDSFRERLNLPQRVDVSLVPKNPLMVSVESRDDGSGAFHLTLEEDFLAELTEEELDAAIAHELGHVWIFTHHPYLQTETLANQIARRVVSRESLVQVYEKLWRRQGTRGDLARYVGD
jgi:hypothetical protein